jgi:hypothetical protein
MQSSLNSERHGRLTLIPFLYMVATRLGGGRDYGYLVVSSWLPGIWILHRMGGHGLAEAALMFAAGYASFISIYEIGYLVNDGWDARKSADGRRRAVFPFTPGYVATFVAVRLGVWAALGTLFGWIGDPVWLGAFAALALAFAEHNLIRGAGFRSASFFQLACLRFMIPVVGETPHDKLLLLLVIAILFYTYYRFIGYLDGKGQLDMPERRLRSFGLVQMAMLAPLIGYLAFALGEPLLIELLGFFLLSYGIYALVARR